MTLVLALPATDGVALVSDTRKWLPSGRYIDGHHKLVSSRHGLLTGAGSGYLLDYVAAHASQRTYPEVVLLIAQAAVPGAWQGERAEWTLTLEGESGGGASRQHSIDFAVYDGFHFKPGWWVAGSLPSGLPTPLVQHASSCVRSIIEEEHCLEEIRTIAFEICSDLYPSGLISPDFDFGTHRPGGQISIERLQIPTASLTQHPHLRLEVN